LKQAVVDLLAAVPIPPRTYYFGLTRTLMETQSSGYHLVFAGRTSADGFWYYYPALFAMKEPLALLLLIGIGIAAWKKMPPLPRPVGPVMGVLTAGIFLAFMFLNHKNIGLRYLLPVYPFLFVWLGRLVTLEDRGWAMPGVVWALVLIYAVNGMASCPDYLVHFNSLVGGPDGGLRYSVEGEDWDQDLPALAQFCRGHGIGEIRFKSRGNSDPTAYGVPVKEWKCGPEEEGWYAVSLSELKLLPEDLGNCYDRFAKRVPDAVIHHTINVYHLVPSPSASPQIGSVRRKQNRI